MWVVYVLQHDTTGELYFGVTSNMKRRLAEHNCGNSRSTRKKLGKWLLVYCEIYRSKSDALRREQRLKHHGQAKQELLKRISQSLIGK